MIIDAETNKLFLSDLLPIKFPNSFSDFEKLLHEQNVSFSFLPNTKDIWAVDFMPIQINENKFVQFDYSPDYLRNFKKWSKTISDVDAICSAINIYPKKSNIRLDGGNAVKSSEVVILCDKIFKENEHLTKTQIKNELENLFQTTQIIFIPTELKDIIGHADGVVRFLNNHTVLVNDLPKSNYKNELIKSLENAGFVIVWVPYNPFNNKTFLDANGVYINYLEMEKIVILPLYNLKEDEKCIRLFEQLFPSKIIKGINCCELAKLGGILNCISWNIKGICYKCSCTT